MLLVGVGKRGVLRGEDMVVVEIETVREVVVGGLVGVVVDAS